MATSVLIVDDHALVRAGLRGILATAPDLVVVGEADNGEAALKLVKQLRPAVMLLDINLSGMSGIEVTQRLQRAHSPTRIIIVTMHAEGPLPRKMLGMGAKAYLSKGCPAEELLTAIRRVAEGLHYIGADIAQQLALASFKADESSQLDSASPRELEVGIGIARGERSNVIAKRLAVSDKTVHTHKNRLMKKLGIQSDAELTRILMRHGLLDR